ncbi:MAG: stage V sporulation T C-terminal domain-containing protein [Eubacteriales bacterium]|nr:stage V sporulation T C-terminal domain-containing protein [Eubacteriales bacterium]
MKATGIVRHIDELGRIVIPKEIRRTLRIRESDPLEIFTDSQGGIILKKYSPIAALNDSSVELVQSINSVSGLTAFICDCEKMIAVCGTLKKTLIDKELTKKLREWMLTKLALNEDASTYSKTPLVADQDRDFFSQSIVPIVWNGNAIGAVGAVSADSTLSIGDSEKLVLKAVSIYLSKQLLD